MTSIIKRLAIAASALALVAGAANLSTAVAEDAKTTTKDTSAKTTTAKTTTTKTSKSKTTVTPSPCKGLVEDACKANSACVWIVPKKANKEGKVPAPYCRKKGGFAAKPTQSKAPAPTTSTTTKSN